MTEEKTPEKETKEKPEAAEAAKTEAAEVKDVKLLKNERDFVVPGDKIVDSIEFLPGRNCFREGDSIYSRTLGIVHIDKRVISVIPLTGVYKPRPGDMVIGEIEEVQSNGWVVDVKCPYEGFLPLSGVREFINTQTTELSRFYDVGDLIYAKVESANTRSVHLSMQDMRTRKFRGGRSFSISPAKVPRLIGKLGSMINMIKDKTGCRIIVGQNGLIWLQGEKDSLAIEAIELIERDAHTEGLTDRIEKLLSKPEKPAKTEKPKKEEKEAKDVKEKS